MRMRWLLVALLSVSATGPVRAGVYFPADPTPWPLPTSPKHFELLLGERQNVGSADPQAVEKPSPLRKRVEAMIKQLEPKRHSGLTLEETLNLSACYLLQPRKTDRQQDSRLPEAIVILEKANRDPRYTRDPRHFMILANLATAYHLTDEYERALGHQIGLLAEWPRQLEGFTVDQLRWYRRAEEVYRELLRRRIRENPKSRLEAKIDALFPHLDELGAEKGFQVGQVDPKIARELPPDALALIEQLLLWLPNDQRLQWLYAELLNANGQTQWAETFLTRLIYAGFKSTAAKEHRVTLRQALEPPPPDEPPPWAPDWRSVLIGLGSGLLVGVLLVLQLWVLFRRRSPARPVSALVTQQHQGPHD